jgi:5-methyltetrahydrofolate--homocysteine methyltransferase
MAIRFDRDRWVEVRRTYDDWWSGKIDRPLFHVAVQGYDPGRPKPELRSRTAEPCADLSVPAEEVVDAWDWETSRWEWLGDAFPIAWPNLGPGVLAAMLGARLNARPESIWYDLPESWGGKAKPIEEIELVWDLDNPWVRRTDDLMRAAMERWNGMVQVGMTDLGGTLDVLSTFRPSERLLLDLVDSPDEVQRLTWQIHELWWQAFDHFNTVLQPVNPGYTAWTPVFSEKTYYMLQCDFCYMIGPRMFREFVMPELAACCRRLENPFYHLDGPGQLPHLDALLEIEELKGFQWVPPAPGPLHDKWPDVYRKIHEAGKLIQIEHRRTDDGRWHIDVIAEQLGSTRGLIVMGRSDITEEAEVRRLLERYGAA